MLSTSITFRPTEYVATGIEPDPPQDLKATKLTSITTIIGYLMSVHQTL